MKLSLKIAFITLLFVSCSNNPLVSKYNDSYSKIRSQLIDREKEVEEALSLMPKEFSEKINLSRGTIVKNDLTQFLKQEKLNESELSQLIDGVSSFISILDKRRDFKPNEKQVTLYSELRKKMLNSEEVLRTYIQNTSNSQDIQGKATALFIEKIMDNDIHSFLSATFTNEEEFSKNMKDYNDNFDFILGNITIANHSATLNNKLQLDSNFK